VVSELRQFYPDEYEIVSMAAVGLKSDFLAFGRDPDLTRHLKAYGIIDLAEDRTPRITLPVLRDFLRKEYSRTRGERIQRELIPFDRRSAWVRDIIERTLHDLRMTLQTADKNQSPFGTRGIPDSDLLNGLPNVTSRDQFESFISCLYKVFYENVTRANDKGVFFKQFKSDWPQLFKALFRIKVYRDFLLHLDVSDLTRQDYERFLASDLGGVDPSQVTDGWFALQQATLDELLYAVQVEAAARGR
jgi:hypothetical protein